MREKENRQVGFDMTLTCTRKGEIYRREERGERREEREKEIKWALTLPLKLERGGRTCPAWIRWSHM